MRTAILIAALATCICMFGCNWFSSKDTAADSFNIEGNWTLDSVQLSSDSSQHIGWLLVSAIRPADSIKPIIFTFKSGDIINTLDGLQADTSHYVLTDKKLTVHHDSTETSFTTSPVSDSLLLLTSADSTTLWLRRQ